MTTILPQCFNCVHFKEDKRFTCKVYPKGISDDILFNEVICSKFKRKEQGKNGKRRNQTTVDQTRKGNRPR